jgi:hypothetical protein
VRRSLAGAAWTRPESRRGTNASFRPLLREEETARRAAAATRVRSVGEKRPCAGEDHERRGAGHTHVYGSLTDAPRPGTENRRGANARFASPSNARTRHARLLRACAAARNLRVLAKSRSGAARAHHAHGSRKMSAARKTHGGGRPPKPARCSRCGYRYTSTRRALDTARKRKGRRLPQRREKLRHSYPWMPLAIDPGLRSDSESGNCCFANARMKETQRGRRARVPNPLVRRRAQTRRRRRFGGRSSAPDDAAEASGVSREEVDCLRGFDHCTSRA